MSPNLADYDKRSGLHLAVSSNMSGVMQLLVKKGARHDQRDRWGITPK